MTVERLIEALHGALDDLQVDDILDALWLASRELELSLYAPTAQTILDDAPKPIESGATSQEETPVENPGDRRARETEATARDTLEDEVPVYASGAGDAGADTVPASPVALPAAFALTNRLALARALQPFRERWPSRRYGELDEEWTAIATAEQRGQLQLVFRPLPERWFDVDFVVDDDLAMGIWHDTLCDFRQMLRETGAFRDVRSWQLRMPVNTTDKDTPVLVSSSGAKVPARVLAGQSVRRLIFFATHGSSQPWLSGSNARLLRDWAREACVVLLQPLDRGQWKRSLLGEPQIRGYVHKPGDVTAALKVERPWWELPDELGTEVNIPVVALTPDTLADWANMQMNRGRRALVYTLDTSEAEFEEADAEQAEQDEDFDSMIATLREASQESFRLAVYLSAGAFTIPVARIVQEAKFGSGARPQHLAEVLLSGLVFTRSSTNGSVDPNEVYYEFFPQAEQILRRSLRSADAELIAESLEQRVSEYIEEIYGRSITFRALVADKSGKYDIPSWAQPFARLGLDLLDRSVLAQTVREKATPKPLDGVRILWIDDALRNNENEIEALTAMGAHIDAADDTRSGLEMFYDAEYQLVISDMARGKNQRAGFDLLSKMQSISSTVPVIIYAGGFAADPKRRESAMAAGAFACTNQRDELYEKVVQAINRAEPAPRSVASSFERGHALVIGVDTSQHISIDHSGVNYKDASTLAEALTRGAGYPQDQVRLCLHEMADRGAILKSLQELMRVTNEDDIVVLVYVGHFHLGASGLPVMTTHDSRIDSAGNVIPGTGITGEELVDIVSKIPARAVLMLFTSSRNIPIEFSNALVKTGRQRVVMTYIESVQPSFDPARSLSPFRDIFFESLAQASLPNRGGWISVFDFFDYVREKTSTTVQEEYRKIQVPELFVRSDVTPFPIAMHPEATTLEQFVAPARPRSSVREMNAEPSENANRFASRQSFGIGTAFVNRQSETRRLLDYVHAPNPHPDEVAILKGPGGIGKTALLHKLLQEISEPAEEALPYALIQLREHERVEPRQLLREIYLQLRRQFPRAAPIDELEKSFFDDDLEESSPSITARGIAAFDAFFSALGKGDQPFVLLFDDFERDAYDNVQLRDFIQALSKRVPTLRTILASREPIAKPGDTVIQLTKFNQEDVHAFILSHGIDAATAGLLSMGFDGTPLQLSLITDLLDKSASTVDLSEVARDYSNLTPFLVSRILSHIDDLEVRRLVLAATVVRYVTPEIIEQVLAVPSGIELRYSDHAHDLFDAMRKEVSLFWSTTDGELRLRPDIREALSQEDTNTMITEIRQYAVQFYVNREGLSARAEEIYHRLLLGESAEIISKRWIEGVDSYLADDFTDLDVHTKLTFLSQLGTIARLQGRWEDMQTLFERMLGVAKSIPEPSAQAFAHQQLSFAAEAKNDLEDARVHARKAIDLLGELENRQLQAIAYGQLGAILTKLEKWDDAVASYENALKLHIDNDDRRAQASTYRNLGLIALEQEDWVGASRNLFKDLKLTMSLEGAEGPEPETTRTLAMLWRRTGDDSIIRSAAEVIGVPPDGVERIFEELTSDVQSG